MKLREHPEIMALSTAEKVDLIHDLWESIAPQVEQSEVSDEEKKLLDERWANYVKNPDSALTLEELKATIAARLK